MRNGNCNNVILDYIWYYKLKLHYFFKKLYDIQLANFKLSGEEKNKVIT